MYGREKGKMTIKDRAITLKKEASSLMLLVLTLAFGLLLSGEAGEYMKEGLSIAINCVIPTSFPFMIISDIYVVYGNPENIGFLRRLVRAVFGLSPCCLAPLICGNIGGFPIGAKMAADSYTMGLITKDEAERLIPLSNNPSCAFIVGGVGLGILGDIHLGFMLLVSVCAATLLCGVLSRKSQNKTTFTDVNIKQNYNFVISVKNAGISSIGIISFISIFSVINGIIKKRIKYAPLLYVISAFSEVTNAVKIFASTTALPGILPLSMIAFSLGFGGICVGLQSSVFITPAGLGMKRYYLTKFLEGILSASIFSFLFILIKQ
jgi:hypothetical protein